VRIVSPPFSRALYDRLPEGFPAQLVDGALLHDPAPLRGHQALVVAIYLALVDRVGLRRAFVAPVDVVIDEWNVLQPDVAMWDAPPPLDRREAEVPAVVFEVLSPANRRLDRGVKAGKYLAAGVREVWLVDPDLRSIEVRMREGRRVARGAVEARSAAVEGFVLVPDALFAHLEP